MKRVELFEFEDFKWFPSWLRACMTNLIIVLHKMMGISEVLSDILAEVLQKQGLSKIVDLGSGSGGPMPLVLEKLNEKEGLQNVQLILTDLYPNPEAIKRFNEVNANKIEYRETSVDATNFVSVPDGLKTMVNSFHHMSPEKARKILRSAEENNQPFLIYEMAENKTSLLVWWVLLPIGLIILMVMTLFMTPFVKPLTWQQVVFTYLVPIIPICYAWDGQASLPRMYSMKDMDLLLEGLGSQDYVWTKGAAMKRNGKKLGTYVMGLPSR